MAIITTNGSFGTTAAVTSTTLNAVADAATFNDPVDETSLELITSGTNIGKLQIKDAGVTKAKIENVANLRVLGNTSGSVVAPQEVEILDDDTMATADAATLATSESIKAYVDSITIGVNQTWQAVTRVIDDTTEYTNSTAKPITVLVNASYIDVGGSDDLAIYMRIKPSGGSFQTLPLINQIGFDGYSSDTGSAIIPPSSTYKFAQGTGGPTITNFQFYELR